MKKRILATIISLIVALIMSASLILGIYIIFRREINIYISLVDKIVVNVDDTVEVDLQIDEASQYLEHYPNYGSRYGNFIMESVGINLPIAYGDTLAILKNNMGHSSGSYFPGEGGSIIYLAHNGKLKKIGNASIGDMITISTTYGDFKYRVYDIEIINDSETDKLPIQREVEILMVYTCYPFSAIHYTEKRFVVYAERVYE